MAPRSGSALAVLGADLLQKGFRVVRRRLAHAGGKAGRHAAGKLTARVRVQCVAAHQKLAHEYVVGGPERGPVDGRFRLRSVARRGPDLEVVDAEVAALLYDERA